MICLDFPRCRYPLGHVENSDLGWNKTYHTILEVLGFRVDGRPVNMTNRSFTPFSFEARNISIVNLALGLVTIGHENASTYAMPSWRGESNARFRKEGAIVHWLLHITYLSHTEPPPLLLRTKFPPTCKEPHHLNTASHIPKECASSWRIDVRAATVCPIAIFKVFAEAEGKYENLRGRSIDGWFDKEWYRNKVPADGALNVRCCDVYANVRCWV